MHRFPLEKDEWSAERWADGGREGVQLFQENRGGSKIRGLKNVEGRMEMEERTLDSICF